jgi:cysteine synthase
MQLRLIGDRSGRKNPPDKRLLSRRSSPPPLARVCQDRGDLKSAVLKLEFVIPSCSHRDNAACNLAEKLAVNCSWRPGTEITFTSGNMNDTLSVAV